MRRSHCTRPVRCHCSMRCVTEVMASVRGEEGGQAIRGDIAWNGGVDVRWGEEGGGAPEGRGAGGAGEKLAEAAKSSGPADA